MPDRRVPWGESAVCIRLRQGPEGAATRASAAHYHEAHPSRLDAGGSGQAGGADASTSSADFARKSGTGETCKNRLRIILDRTSRRAEPHQSSAGSVDRLGWTQGEIAEKVGIDQAGVSRKLCESTELEKRIKTDSLSFDIWANQSTQEFVKALEAETGIPASELIVSIRGAARPKFPDSSNSQTGGGNHRSGRFFCGITGKDGCGSPLRRCRARRSPLRMRPCGGRLD